jgi:putative FmdB family regulatory protein
MPTYEYECPRCPRVFEVRQRITEPAIETCERCGGPVRRLLSAAPFILKGEGWYVTDYPSEARKKAKDAAASKDGTSKGDGGSAESKPAASSESKSSTEGSAGPPSSVSKPAGSG